MSVPALITIDNPALMPTSSQVPIRVTIPWEAPFTDGEYSVIAETGHTGTAVLGPAVGPDSRNVFLRGIPVDANTAILATITDDPVTSAPKFASTSEGIEAFGGADPAAGEKPIVRVGSYWFEPTDYEQMEDGPARHVWRAYGRIIELGLFVQWYWYFYPGTAGVLPRVDFELSMPWTDMHDPALRRAIPPAQIRFPLHWRFTSTWGTVRGVSEVYENGGDNVVDLWTATQTLGDGEMPTYRGSFFLTHLTEPASPDWQAWEAHLQHETVALGHPTLWQGKHGPWRTIPPLHPSLGDGVQAAADYWAWWLGWVASRAPSLWSTSPHFTGIAKPSGTGDQDFFGTDRSHFLLGTPNGSPRLLLTMWHSAQFDMLRPTHFRHPGPGQAAFVGGINDGRIVEFPSFPANSLVFETERVYSGNPVGGTMGKGDRTDAPGIARPEYSLDYKLTDPLAGKNHAHTGEIALALLRLHTGSYLLQDELRHKCAAYFYMRPTDAGPGVTFKNAGEFRSTRCEFAMAWLHYGNPDTTLRSAVVQRFKDRADPLVTADGWDTLRAWSVATDRRFVATHIESNPHKYVVKCWQSFTLAQYYAAYHLAKPDANIVEILYDFVMTQVYWYWYKQGANWKPVSEYYLLGTTPFMPDESIFNNGQTKDQDGGVGYTTVYHTWLIDSVRFAPMFLREYADTPGVDPTYAARALEAIPRAEEIRDNFLTQGWESFNFNQQPNIERRLNHLHARWYWGHTLETLDINHRLTTSSTVNVGESVVAHVDGLPFLPPETVEISESIYVVRDTVRVVDEDVQVNVPGDIYQEVPYLTGDGGSHDFAVHANEPVRLGEAVVVDINPKEQVLSEDIGIAETVVRTCDIVVEANEFVTVAEMADGPPQSHVVVVSEPVQLREIARAPGGGGAGSRPGSNRLGRLPMHLDLLIQRLLLDDDEESAS
jgi:hypothetical protein